MKEYSGTAMIFTKLNRREFIASVSKGIFAASSLPLYANPLYRQGVKSTGYVYDERFLGYSNNPESPKRLEAIQQRMQETGLSLEVENLPLYQSPLDYIKSIYSDAYISTIQATGAAGSVAELAVAGALGAVQAVCNGTVKNAFCAIRPPGHHAKDGNSAGEGFCYFNNVTIAAKFLQASYPQIKKILIIDWDYHHGNATQDIFYTDPTVLYFSTHNWHDYPETGDPAMTGAGAGLGYNINVHLDPGATDDIMKKAWEEKLLPAAESFKPDFVLISAGFDGRTGEKYGKFEVTDQGFADLTKMALTIARQHCNGRLVSILEGGYTVAGLALAATSHIAELLNESSEAINHNNHNTTHCIYIRGNVLYLPASFKHSAQIAIRNTSGSLLKKIAHHTLQIDLAKTGLSAGHYFIDIKTADQKSITLPFHYIQ